MSLRQAQEDITQRRKEQEYYLPKLKKKRLQRDENSGSKANEEQLEGQQHCHLFCECFYASLSKETKWYILSNITDNQTVAWACGFQLIFSE